MQIKNNVNLAKYSTLKIGGLCNTMWFPQNDVDIQTIWQNAPQAFRYIIGNGSNILINDKKIFPHVICTKKLNCYCIRMNNCIYKVGSGLMLRQLIDTIYEDSYGGIDFLASVPGTVGGAVVMNAGRGREYNLSIGDYVKQVNVFYRGKIKTFKHSECNFEYRNSIFKEKKEYIILSVDFEFPHTNKELFKKAINERISSTKKSQDNDFPNLGSVFKTYDFSIIDSIRTQKDTSDTVSFSSKTNNWILNKGNGTYNEAKKKIEEVKQLHKQLNKKYELEIVDWN